MRTEYEDLDKERRQAVDFLQKNRTEEALWECVIVYQRYPFHTVSGLPFQYELKHGRDGTWNKELVIDRREGSKSLTWSSFRRAFQNVSAQGIKPFVQRPKALGDIRGVSYMYPMFYRFGIISVPEKFEEIMKNCEEDLNS